MAKESILNTLKIVFKTYNITKMKGKVVYEAENNEHYVLTGKILKEMVDRELSERDYVKRNYF